MVKLQADVQTRSVIPLGGGSGAQMTPLLLLPWHCRLSECRAVTVFANGARPATCLSQAGTSVAQAACSLSQLHAVQCSSAVSSQTARAAAEAYASARPFQVCVPWLLRMLDAGTDGQSEPIAVLKSRALPPADSFMAPSVYSLQQTEASPLVSLAVAPDRRLL